MLWTVYDKFGWRVTTLGFSTRNGAEDYLARTLANWNGPSLVRLGLHIAPLVKRHRSPVRADGSRDPSARSTVTEDGKVRHSNAEWIENAE